MESQNPACPMGRLTGLALLTTMIYLFYVRDYHERHIYRFRLWKRLNCQGLRVGFNFEPPFDKDSIKAYAEGPLSRIAVKYRCGHPLKSYGASNGDYFDIMEKFDLPSLPWRGEVRRACKKMKMFLISRKSRRELYSLKTPEGAYVRGCGTLLAHCDDDFPTNKLLIMRK